MTAALAFFKAGEHGRTILKTSVDNYSTVDRLARLAPLHQRAAISRAMHLAGMRGVEKPSLDTLSAAENPPEKKWAEVQRTMPTEKTIQAIAERLVTTREWRDKQAKVTSRTAQLREAVLETGNRLKEEWVANRTYQNWVNVAEFYAGQRLAATWKPVLDTLEELLDTADEAIPDLHLAAVPEKELRQMAKDRAKAGICRLYPQFQTEIESMDRDVFASLDGFDPTPDECREMGQRAHLRTLRKKAKAARQHASALFGTVGWEDAAYVDDYSRQRWKERQDANARYAETQVLVTEDGKAIPMASILAKKKAATTAQFYAMCKAMDEYATTHQGWTGVFVTATLPPEYHPNPANGHGDYNPAKSPRAADQELQHRLAKLRARMAKARVPVFGIRVAEPHKDGCPHTHLLLYMPAADIPNLDAMLLKLFPETVPGQRNASRMVHIDPKLSNGFSYLAKNVMADNDTEDGQGHGERVRAWASERSIRRWAL